MSEAAIGHVERDGFAAGPYGAPSEATARDFFALLKPRVMSLVVLSGLAGLVIAPGAMNPIAAFTAILCIAVGAGASGALNMWYDADIDAVMARTAKRPIPAGKIAPHEALTFGLVLSAFSVGTMGVLVNWLSAGLLAFTIVFYVAVYTMVLKRRTPHNIVIGGLAGAMPPAIGWAAATNSLALPPLILVAIIFLWTPPHFWALALYRSADYARAGVPMLPVTAGEAATRRQIFGYTILTVLASFAPVGLGFASWIYALSALVGGAMFLAQAIAVLRRPGDHRSAMKLFGTSILYLFALFIALIVETAVAMAPVITP